MKRRRRNSFEVRSTILKLAIASRKQAVIAIMDAGSREEM
jgi:hypothetical protein